jgi:hypothetical protein
MERIRDGLAGKPLDRALLACLAEETEDGAPAADLGAARGMFPWASGGGR